MAGSFSDYMEQETLEWITGQTSDLGTPPSTVYIGLFTVDPSDAGGGTEVTGGSYAREDSVGSWAAPSGGSVSTNADISFTQATASWGTVTAVALFDAVTGGNMLAWAELDEDKTVGNGDTFKLASGDATITLD